MTHTHFPSGETNVRHFGIRIMGYYRLFACALLVAMTALTIGCLAVETTVDTLLVADDSKNDTFEANGKGGILVDCDQDEDSDDGKPVCVGLKAALGKTHDTFKGTIGEDVKCTSEFVTKFAKKEGVKDLKGDQANIWTKAKGGRMYYLQAVVIEGEKRTNVYCGDQYTTEVKFLKVGDRFPDATTFNGVNVDCTDVDEAASVKYCKGLLSIQEGKFGVDKLKAVACTQEFITDFTTKMLEAAHKTNEKDPIQWTKEEKQKTYYLQAVGIIDDGKKLQLVYCGGGEPGGQLGEDNEVATKLLVAGSDETRSGFAARGKKGVLVDCTKDEDHDGTNVCKGLTDALGIAFNDNLTADIKCDAAFVSSFEKKMDLSAMKIVPALATWVKDEDGLVHYLQAVVVDGDKRTNVYCSGGKISIPDFSLLNLGDEFSSVTESQLPLTGVKVTCDASKITNDHALETACVGITEVAASLGDTPDSVQVIPIGQSTCSQGLIDAWKTVEDKVETAHVDVAVLGSTEWKKVDDGTTYYLVGAVKRNKGEKFGLLYCGKTMFTPPDGGKNKLMGFGQTLHFTDEMFGFVVDCTSKEKIDASVLSPDEGGGASSSGKKEVDVCTGTKEVLKANEETEMSAPLADGKVKCDKSFDTEWTAIVADKTMIDWEKQQRVVDNSNGGHFLIAVVQVKNSGGPSGYSSGDGGQAKPQGFVNHYIYCGEKSGDVTSLAKPTTGKPNVGMKLGYSYAVAFVMVLGWVGILG